MEEDKNGMVMEEQKSEVQTGEKEENVIEATVEEELIQSQPADMIEKIENPDIEELDTSPISKAEEWLRLNEGNLKYLDINKVNRIKELLLRPDQLDANSIAEIQKLQEDLEKEAEKKFNEQFNDVKRGLVKLREEMFQIPNYDNLPDELQEVALNTFTNCELRLSNTRLIDELVEIFDNFKNVVYPDLSQKIYALENPNVLPINLIEVMDSMPRLSYSTEEELDSALTQLREAAIKRLKKSKVRE